MNIKFNQLLSLDLNETLRKKLVDYCTSLPIIGFNSSFYEIGLLSKDGFILYNAILLHLLLRIAIGIK